MADGKRVPLGVLPARNADNTPPAIAGGQSARESWREAWQNTACAFVLSLLSHRYIIAPNLELWVDGGGEIGDWIPAALTTIYYTLLSLARNFIVRRVGNRRMVKRATLAEATAE